VISTNHTQTLGASIAAHIEASIATKQAVLEAHVDTLGRIAGILTGALCRGNKILFCGNGGSAADSQHLAAELIGRFRRERAALPAIALTTDTSILTALANDYSYDLVFARQVEAFGREGDVVVGISTSGNSPNVLRAMDTAKALGLHTIGLTGASGGKLKDMVDVCFCVPSNDTCHIQETHITVGHAVCELIEKELFDTDGSD
jgi:D-sedoheptulose 7-phosphate isomerase